jgi:hypothetical protein
VAILWLSPPARFSLRADALFGHSDFGKPACPGNALRVKIDQLRAEPDLLGSLTPKTSMEWQRALVTLGYDLGTSGPKADGVDGVWGSLSQRALVAFQTSRGIPRSATTDGWTAHHVALALNEKASTVIEPEKKTKSRRAR